MESNERDFKGVWIKKEIWLDRNLSCIEKCLLAEIDSLDNDEEKGCFASNKYLGEFIGVTEGRMANIISDLKKRGYIVQCYFDGRNRGLRVNENVKAESKRESRLHENVKAGLTKTLKQTSRKREHINTYNNTSINTTTTTIKEVVDVPDFVKKEKEEFKLQALDYQKESNRLDAEQTKDLIRNNASLKEELIKFFTRTTLYKQADKQAHDKIRLNIRLREFFEVVLDEHITRNKSEELYPRKSSESIKHFRNYFKKKIDNLSESEYRQFLKLLIS
jgi:hypothetical protein